MNVKIFLEPGETQEEADERLLKALQSQRTGETHREQFPDKAMEKRAKMLKRFYAHHVKEMLAEIEEALNDSK